MKFAIFSRSESPDLNALCDHITALGGSFALNPCQFSDSDMAISLGGDGTFLSTARKVVPYDLPILGINGGRLGFLATTPLSGALRALEDVVSGRFTIENRAMIKVEGIQADHGDALNEFSLQKRTPAMVNVQMSIDGQRVAGYWADGVIVSTPTGSTAYSMSVGGAILAPLCRCFVISPIAPHNLNVRPLVVSDNARIELRIQTRNTPYATATIDNRDFCIDGDAVFSLSRSSQTVPIVQLPQVSFYETLREKLHWGLDPRNQPSPCH